MDNCLDGLAERWEASAEVRTLARNNFTLIQWVNAQAVGVASLNLPCI